MIRLAASIVRLWVRLYTAGLEESVRERIRLEIEADLWEELNSRESEKHPTREALIIMLRWILGIQADMERIGEESNSGGFSMWTKKVFGVVTQRRSWLNLLILSAISFSLLFIGLGTFIAAIFIIGIPAVLLASPLIALLSGGSLGPISLHDAWQVVLLFFVGLAILVSLLHLSKLVYRGLKFGVSAGTGTKKRTGPASQVFSVLYDPRAWTSLFFVLLGMLSLVFLGVGSFTAAITLAVVTGALIANPFIYPHHTVSVGPVVINNPAESALLVIAGLGLALIILHLSNALVGTVGKGIISRFRQRAMAST